MFDRFQEGAVVTAVPYNDDGLGNKRAKLYKRMGFKPNLKEPLELSIVLIEYIADRVSKSSDTVITGS